MEIYYYPYFTDKETKAHYFRPFSDKVTFIFSIFLREWMKVLLAMKKILWGHEMNPTFCIATGSLIRISFNGHKNKQGSSNVYCREENRLSETKANQEWFMSLMCVHFGTWYPVRCPKAVLPGRLRSGPFLFLFGILCSCANRFPLLIMSLSVPPSHLVAKLPLSWWEMGLTGTLFVSYLAPNLPNSFQSWHVPWSYSNWNSYNQQS